MKINDLTFFLLAFLYLFAVLFSNNEVFNLVLLLVAFVNVIIFRKIRFDHLLFFILLLLIPIISVFFTTILYTKGAESSILITQILGISVYSAALENAIYLSSRAFSLSTISFFFVLVIKFDVLIFSLMQNLKLPVPIGYSLLSAFNALEQMKNEFFRIRTTYLMRFQKKRFPLFLIIPLLVSASRYAYYAGLSLESRGLHNKKTYIVKYPLSWQDFIVILINICEIVILVILF